MHVSGRVILPAGLSQPSIKGLFDLRLHQDNQAPDPDRQANDAAGADAGNHGQDTGGHCQAPVFEILHF